MNLLAVLGVSLTKDDLLVLIEAWLVCIHQTLLGIGWQCFGRFGISGHAERHQALIQLWMDLEQICFAYFLGNTSVLSDNTDVTFVHPDWNASLLLLLDTNSYNRVVNPLLTLLTVCQSSWILASCVALFFKLDSASLRHYFIRQLSLLLAILFTNYRVDCALNQIIVS